MVGVHGTATRLGRDPTSIRHYLRFYEARRDRITDEVRRRHAAIDAWPELLMPVAPGGGDTTAWNQEAFRLLRTGALENAWEPFLERLRIHGATCAMRGVAFRRWLDLWATYRDVIYETCLEDHALDATSVKLLGHGLGQIVDACTEMVSDAYFTIRSQASAQAQSRYQAIFDHNPNPMWTFDRATMKFALVNAAALTLYGYSRDEFMKLTVFDLRLPEDHSRLEQDVAGTGSWDQPATRTHRRKDGSHVRVDVRTRDFELDGETMRFAMITDVTEREQAMEKLQRVEDQLRHTQKMDAIGQLAGGVAHDFNNLLTVIKNAAYFLEEDLAEGTQSRSDATDIRRAAERAAGITRQLLTLSRRGKAQRQSLELDQVVGGFVPMLRSLVGEQVKLNIRRATVPSIIGDVGQLEQVVMNLVVNARDAMPTGGRLTIETSATDLDAEAAAARALAPGRYVVLSVTDTGSGMDRETQQRIFEPFYTTKVAGKGTGLGLSIVHGVVTQAGGSIFVYSEVGHGTTFRIYFPVAESVIEAPAGAPRAVDALPPITVLVVDDQRDIRAVAIRILQAAGCHAIEAATADDARSICISYEEPIDVALIDVVLGDGRGEALVDELGRLRPGLATVLMSGYPAGSLVPEGATPPDLLVKPFSPAELRAAVARTLDTAAGAGVGTAKGVERKAPAPRRARILIADDDAAIRAVLQRTLVKANFEVTAVDDGHTAIEALSSSTFDAVLTDVQMPGASGIDLLREARRVDLDVPVILMSGNPDVTSATTAIEYGAFRYLTKPFDLQAVGAVVRQAVQAQALARIRREAVAISGAGQAAADRAGLEVRFEQALDGLWVAVQPIVDKVGAPYGFEVLMRSHETSMATPDRILEAATTLGRIAELGRRVRRLAATCPGAGTVFVNLHPLDLHDPDLLDPTTPLSLIASRVVLEVTERAALTSSPELSERIALLRARGFRFAIDDIGAGYSGLTSFTEIMPEVVKLDMSLVRDVHRSTLKQRTITALASLCHEVGTIVVGEGIETADERACLVDLGCDLLQGYLFGRPRPAHGTTIPPPLGRTRPRTIR
jgi:PAS domain S-box-containing protein